MALASLASHGHVVRGAADRITQWGRSAVGVTHVTVDLIDGVQAGLHRDMKLASMTIGAAEGSEICLLDEDVAPTHAKVRFEKSAFGVLAEVEALDRGVHVDGHSLGKGQSISAVTLPFELKVATARLEFRRPGAAMATGRVGHFLSNFDPLLGLAFVVLFITLIGGFFWDLLAHRDPFVVGTNRVSQTEVERPLTKAEWMDSLQGQLEGLGLSGVLTVREMPDQILALRGMVPETQLAAYRELQGWYEAQPGAPSLVWNVDKSPKLNRLPNIGLVRFSDPPAVVLTSGAVIALGEEITDDWVLADVSETALTLRRGVDTQMVDFRAVME